MRFVNYTLTLLLLVLMCTIAEAQQGKLKRAERLMGQHNYKGAIQLYLNILDKGDNAEAAIGIAECYRMVGNSDETEYWYGFVSKLPNAPQKSWLFYAMALQQNNKCNLSKQWAEKYLNEIEPNNTQAMWLVKSCEEGVVDDLRASGKLYQVKNLEEINTNKDEFAPQYFKNDLVFISSREKKVASKRFNRWTNDEEKSFTEVYRSVRKQLGEVEEYSFKYGSPKKFSKKLSTKFHDGPVCFNADFNEIYFTRSNMNGKADDGIIRLKVYQSKGPPSKYSDPRSLPVNSDEYSVLHPSLSDDGEMLFFSSDMPGGFGGYDLYVSYLEEGRWSPPVNLGPTINTEGNEVFPYHHHSGTLYFASNGLVGLGGLDIYYSKENYSAWTDPINLGYPVNTTEDDFGFIINRERTHGYFSSNRDNGKGGDDIYTFTKLSVTIEISVYDEITKIPIEAADVFTPCSAVQNLLTNQDGKIILELPLDMACDFASEKLGYQPNSVHISTKKKAPGQVLYAKIPLKLECIFIVAGQVTDGHSGNPIDSAKVRLQTYCSGELDEQIVMTDVEGRYEFRDVREDCDIRVTVEKIGFTKGSATFKTGTKCGEAAVAEGLIDTSGAYVQSIPLYCFGEHCENGELPPPDGVIDSVMNGDGTITVTYQDGREEIINLDGTVDIVNQDGSLSNKPMTGATELINIYYDFDDSKIRSEAAPVLDNLVTLLEMYPEMKIKITSHTDARGKKGYNRNLSKRRANSVVQYLTSQGISRSRLKAKGMGEKVMINRCYDGIECTEELHQENRRTEFVITEFVPDGFDAESKKPTSIKTNPCTNCPSASSVEEDY